MQEKLKIKYTYGNTPRACFDWNLAEIKRSSRTGNHSSQLMNH